MMMDVVFFYFCKQKPAYKMRISDWSSDVSSSDLPLGVQAGAGDEIAAGRKDAILDQYRLNVLRVAHEGLLCDAMPRRIVVMAHPRMPIIPQLRAAMRSARSASAMSQGRTDRKSTRLNSSH